MNDKSHTTGGGYESQTPHNLDLSLPGLPTQASLWNSPLGRRAFLKKTGAATVATAVAMHGFRVQVQAAVTGLAIKTQEWECRLTISEARGTAYTAAEIAAAQTNYLAAHPLRFIGAPTGPPTGANKVSGPVTTAWWPTATAPLYNFVRSRDPQPPVAADEVIGGQHYITFRYKYIEDQQESEVLPPC